MLAPPKPRIIRAARGNTLSARTWMTEAPLRMLMNNLDAEVAGNPAELVVYGGIGRAARDWNCYDRIVETLKSLTEEETLLVQSGKPVARVSHSSRCAARAHRQLESRAALGNLGTFPRARSQGAGDVRSEMTAGSWIYIGSQELCRARMRRLPKWARRHFGGTPLGQMDSHRGLGRHGRRAAAGCNYGRRESAGRGMPLEPHRQAPRDRLHRCGGAHFERCFDDARDGQEPAAVGGVARQHCRCAGHASRTGNQTGTR